MGSRRWKWIELAALVAVVATLVMWLLAPRPRSDDPGLWHALWHRLPPVAQQDREQCMGNLTKELASALLSYFEREGRYPDSLDALKQPWLLRGLPSCPTVGRDTYSAGYSTNGQECTLVCRGQHLGRVLQWSSRHGLSF